jgi:hypothetical protein
MECCYERNEVSQKATTIIHTAYMLNSSELRSPEFPRIPSATRPEYFTISTLEVVFICIQFY